MAIYNEILVGRYARGLQKLFGIKGSVPAKQLAGEVMPVHFLFNGVENRYLEGWERFAQNQFITGAATFNGKVRLRNPAGSNVIMVIEKAVASAPTANDQPLLDGGTGNADLANVVALTRARLDPRGRPQPVAIFSNENSTAGFGSGTPNFSLSTGVTTQNNYYDYINNENQEIPVLPGDFVQIRSNVVNNAFTATFLWRERFLEDSERA